MARCPIRWRWQRHSTAQPAGDASGDDTLTAVAAATLAGGLGNDTYRLAGVMAMTFWSTPVATIRCASVPVYASADRSTVSRSIRAGDDLRRPRCRRRADLDRRLLRTTARRLSSRSCSGPNGATWDAAAIQSKATSWVPQQRPGPPATTPSLSITLAIPSLKD
jgi:hypothetical protein